MKRPVNPRLFYIEYFFISVIFNFISIPVHELGHWTIASLEGKKEYLHFTYVDSMGAPDTLMNISGGFVFSIFVAAILLLFFQHYYSMFLFSAIFANTFFVRVLPYIYGLVIGNLNGDEAIAAGIVKINRLFVLIPVITIMLVILTFTFIKLKSTRNKKEYLYITVLSFAASLVSFPFMLILVYARI